MLTSDWSMYQFIKSANGQLTEVLIWSILKTIRINLVISSVSKPILFFKNFLLLT
jgi:hypothetical protein